VRAKRAARKRPAATEPAQALRRLPIRDASMPTGGETALVLTAFGVSPQSDGVNPIALAATVLLSLAAALLALAYVAPFLVDQQRFGPFLYQRRNQVAHVGANMIAAAVVCYLVVALS
jgi:hypothetical protein